MTNHTALQLTTSPAGPLVPATRVIRAANVSPALPPRPARQTRRVSSPRIRAALTTIAVLLTGLSAAVSPAHAALDDPKTPAAQSEPQRPNPRVAAARERAAAAARERAGDLSRDEIRARLLKRIEETQKIEAGLREALARLDAGDDQLQVWSEIEKLRPILGDLLSPVRRGQPAAPQAQPGAGQTRGESAPPGAQRAASRAEARARVLSFLDDNMPIFAARLRESEKTDRALVDNTVSKIGPRIDDLLRTKREEPDFFPVRLQELRLGITMFEVARQLGEASNSAAAPERIAALEDQLMKLGFEMFDVREKVQERDLANVNARAAQLQRELAEQRGNRDDIVRSRVIALIQRAKNAGHAQNRKPAQDPAKADSRPGQ